jgi:uncharacterized protein YndB with AHSA1/START domain
MNETLSTVAGRSVLRLERHLAHPPEKVWRAVTEPAHLAHWFPCDVHYDSLTVGAVLSFEFRAGEAPPSTGTITEVDPPRTFAFTWGDSAFRIELDSERDGCRLMFSHTFDDRYGAASFASGWDVCLAALGRDLAGEPAAPDTDAGERHEHYLHQFGLEAGTSTEDDDGWTVRFERQLVRPVATVWAILVGSGPAPAVGQLPPAGFVAPPGAAGPITAMAESTELAYGWAGTTVRWQFGPGTGHGPRLVLTQTGGAESTGQRETAVAAWSERLEALAKELLSAPMAG